MPASLVSCWRSDAEALSAYADILVSTRYQHVEVCWLLYPSCPLRRAAAFIPSVGADLQRLWRIRARRVMHMHGRALMTGARMIACTCSASEVTAKPKSRRDTV